MRLVNATPISLKDFIEILMEVAGTVSRLFRKECHKYIFFSVLYTGYRRFDRSSHQHFRALKQLRRRPQRRLQKTIGLMIKTTALHVHHPF